MRSVKFLFSHSIFISLCSFALCFQSYILFKQPVNYYACLFLFSSTLCCYNLYALLDLYFTDSEKKVELNRKDETSHIILLIFGALLSLFFLYELQNSLLHISIVLLLSLTYFIPLLPYKGLIKVIKIGYFKTFLLALTWTYSTVFIPLSTVRSYFCENAISFFMIRLIFMHFLCVIFDLRDVNKDQSKGLKNFFTSLNKLQLKWLMLTLFITYIFLVNSSDEILSIDNHQKWVLSLSGIAAYFLYLLGTIKNRGYYFYYFWVDGLMLFSAFASYVATI